MSPNSKLGLGAGALAVLLLSGLVPSAAFGQNSDLYNCSKRVINAVGKFSEGFVETVGECHLENLEKLGRSHLDCVADEDIVDELNKTADKMRREVTKCGPTQELLCPLEAESPADLVVNVSSGAGSLAGRLRSLLDDVFITPYPACSLPRPQSEQPSAVEDCGDRIHAAIVDAMEEVEKCYFGCMLSNVRRPSNEPCIDPETGDATQEKLQECISEVLEDVGGEINNRCKPTTKDGNLLLRLGCPLGASTVAGVSSAINARLAVLIRDLNKGIFRSSCRDGEPGEVPPLAPAPVTMLPSLRTTSVICGQRLDAAFFGADNTVRFEGNLDCSASATALDGIIVAASNVTVSGNATKYSIIGPKSNALRTGAGVRVAAGARNVNVKDFRSLEFFGAGVQDSGDNDGLVIEKLTVRRSRVAGVLTTTPRITIDAVTADRNVVGIEVWGDETEIKRSRARRSEPAPGIGVFLRALDDDGDGNGVRLRDSSIEENMTGVQIDGFSNRADANDIRSNVGDGIVITGTGAQVHENSLKLNLGDGIVVAGNDNLVTANRSDENAGAGYVVTGLNNRIEGNGSGTLTDNGNLGAGYVIDGAGTRAESNRAEANQGGGFKLLGPTAVFKLNDATENAGIGFDVESSGNTLDTNVAAGNTASEFDIAPGNADGQGNRTNGRVFSFSAAGGTFE